MIGRADERCLREGKRSEFEGEGLRGENNRTVKDNTSV
jgi:hypothetical protein